MGEPVDKDAKKRFQFWSGIVPIATPGQIRGQEIPLSGNCIQVRGATGVLTITTNKNNWDILAPGEMTRFDNGFTSLRITSTVANDFVELSVGYGLKFQPSIANITAFVPNPMPVSIVGPNPASVSVRSVRAGDGLVNADLKNIDTLGLATAGYLINGQTQIAGGASQTIPSLFGAAPYYTPVDWIEFSCQTVPASPPWVGPLTITGEFTNSGAGPGFSEPIQIFGKDRTTLISSQGIIPFSGFWFLNMFGFNGLQIVNGDPANPVHIGIMYCVEGKGR